MSGQKPSKSHHTSGNDTVMTIGDAGEGSIEPNGDQLEKLDGFIQEIRRGTFHKKAQIIDLAACVDGRRPKKNTGLLVANSAGGTLTYFVADNLTSRRIGRGGSTLDGFIRMADYLRERGVTLGDHTGAHAPDDETRCGANDRMEDIYAYIVRRGDVLRDWSAKLGIKVRGVTHALIIEQARSISNFSPSPEIKAALQKRTSPALVPELQGEHMEVATVINMRKGTTLDREALAERFGADMQAFNVDAWQFENAALQLTDSEIEAERMVAAMVYYNLATAFVLCGPGMRIVVLE